jgi:hypothetical protein
MQLRDDLTIGYWIFHIQWHNSNKSASMKKRKPNLPQKETKEKKTQKLRSSWNNNNACVHVQGPPTATCMVFPH